ncbi:MAG: MarR family transcriptional regulator, partial [Candidatus Dormiibacterota bacterium]
MPDAAEVRKFNRYYSERLGLLADRYLGQARPLAQARLLFEIGAAGASVRTLRHRLSLDSGYLSRLLRALESQRLISVQRADSDGRVRVARLTDAGREELAELERRSQAAAAALLASLAAPQRQAVVAAMGMVRRTLS